MKTSKFEKHDSRKWLFAVSKEKLHDEKLNELG